jgi:hypothetical protein
MKERLTALTAIRILFLLTSFFSLSKKEISKSLSVASERRIETAWLKTGHYHQESTGVSLRRQNTAPRYRSADNRRGYALLSLSPSWYADCAEASLVPVTSIAIVCVTTLSEIPGSMQTCSGIMKHTVCRPTSRNPAAWL